MPTIERAACFAAAESRPIAVPTQAAKSIVRVLACPLGAGAEVLEAVLVGLVGCSPARDGSRRRTHRRPRTTSAAHGADLDRQAILDRTGEREQPLVGEELTVEGDRAVVEQGPDDVDALLDPGQRLGVRPVDRRTARAGRSCRIRARPRRDRSVSSSRVAAACAMSVGSRNTTPDRLGPNRMFVRVLRCGREQQPQVLVPGLVGGVAPVEAQFVGQLDALVRTPRAGSPGASRN